MRVLPGVALVLLGVAAAGWLALPPDRGTVAHSRTERASAMPVLNVNRRGTGFVARGSVPDTGTLSRLQAEGVTGLRLASGAPDAAWTQAVLAGLTGLRHLEVGQFELRDRRLSFLGTATTPVEGAALEHAVTAALPSGFTATYALGFRDDLQPVAYRVHYDVVGGTDLVGKLPVGTSATDIAHALGLDDLDDGAQVAVQGAQGAPSPALAVLRDWLGVVETLDVTVDADSTHVRMSLGAAWDLEAVHQELALGLPDIVLEVTAAPAAEGTRVRALGGVVEVASAGFWLPEVAVVPDPGQCERSSADALSGGPDVFGREGAALALRAPVALNALAGVARACLAGGLDLSISDPDPARAAILAASLRRRLPAARITDGVGPVALRLQWHRG